MDETTFPSCLLGQTVRRREGGGGGPRTTASSTVRAQHENSGTGLMRSGLRTRHRLLLAAGRTGQPQAAWPGRWARLVPLLRGEADEGPSGGGGLAPISGLAGTLAKAHTLSLGLGTETPSACLPMYSFPVSLHSVVNS